jgi:hypothetical protein
MARTYTVVHGDTLSSIARKLNAAGSWKALRELNKDMIPIPDRITVGLVLVLPEPADEGADLRKLIQAVPPLLCRLGKKASRDGQPHRGRGEPPAAPAHRPVPRPI